jgi:hypothetical protein
MHFRDRPNWSKPHHKRGIITIIRALKELWVIVALLPLKQLQTLLKNSFKWCELFWVFSSKPCPVCSVLFHQSDLWTKVKMNKYICIYTTYL